MGRNYDEQSKLKTKEVTKVITNKKDYTFGDFKFKFIVDKTDKFWTKTFIEAYNFDSLILKVWVSFYIKDNIEKLSDFDIIFFNPKTNNDCNSINHIIKCFVDLLEDKHSDKGNASLINNQYIFRRKDNYYSYTKIWHTGIIEINNYDKDLSYHFATDEYINLLKKIYGFKKMPRRDMKKKIKEIITGVVGYQKKKKFVEAMGK